LIKLGEKIQIPLSSLISRMGPVLNDSTSIIHSNSRRELLQGACHMYEGWNFNSGNYLFTTDTK